MPERKQILASICIFILIVQWLLPLIQFWPILQDKEYDAALLRAEQQQLPDIIETKKYPFSMMNRAEGAERFAWFAQKQWSSYISDQCSFSDIAILVKSQQDAIIAGCRYGFFKWFKGWFVPHDPLSKAAAIVIITRIVVPERSFPDVKEFREPYMKESVQRGILKKPDHPYLMYPISRYELLLMLYRASQV